MTPQPLSRVKANADVRWGPETLKPYPELVCLVMETINLGSQIDYNWSVIMIDLLKAEPKAGMAMLEALSGGEARRSVLLAAAKTVLPEDDFFLLQAVERTLAPTRRTRNDFAHRIWGASSDIPNALLLIDPAGLSKFEVGIATTNLAMSKTNKILLFPDMDKSMIAVWKKKYLQQARKSMIDALSTLAILGNGLNLSFPNSEIGEPARLQLLNLPVVAQALERLSQQKTPQAHPKQPAKKRPMKK